MSKDVTKKPGHELHEQAPQGEHCGDGSLRKCPLLGKELHGPRSRRAHDCGTIRKGLLDFTLPSQARRLTLPNRVHLRYGLVVHLLLLST